MGPIVGRLKAIREAAGLSLEDVAVACGWQDHTQASRVERGLKPTSIEKIEAWIDRCGYDVYIVNRAGRPGSDEIGPLLARLNRDQRELLLRLARLVPDLESSDAGRLTHDVEYLERRYGRRRD